MMSEEVLSELHMLRVRSGTLRKLTELWAPGDTIWTLT